MPSPPTVYFASAGDGVIELQFQPLDGPWYSIGTLQVFRALGPGGYGDEPLCEVPGETRSYSDTSVSNGQTYYYRMRAAISGQLSDFSAEVSATPSASGRVPGAPQSATGLNGGVCAVITWSPPTDPGSSPITGYDVYRGEIPNIMLSEKVSSLPWNAHIANLSVERSGQNMFYFVKARNPYGEGNAAGPTPVNVSMGGEVPSAPRSLRAEGGDWCIYLLWERPASPGSSIIKEYLVYRRAEGTPWEFQGAVPAGVHNFRDSSAGLALTVAYQYVVVAASLSGMSPASQVVTCTMSSTAHAPSPPQNVTVVQSTPYSVRVSWSPPADDGGGAIFGYVIRRDVDGTWTESWSDVNSYLDETVEPGTNCSYRVAAITNFATFWDLNFSAAVNITPRGSAQIPTAPFGLRAFISYQNIITLTWLRPADPSITGVMVYEVSRSDVPGDWTGASLMTAGTVSVDDVNVTSGSIYWYRVRAISAGGPGPWSEAIQATCSPIPLPPGELHAFAGEDRVRLVWGFPADRPNEYSETSYRIYRLLPEGGTARIAEVGPGVFTYLDEDVVAGQAYRYSVSSTRWGQEGNLSLAASATTSVSGSAPPAPVIAASPSHGGIAVYLGQMQTLFNQGAFGFEIWVGRPDGEMRLWDHYEPEFWPGPGAITYYFSLERCNPDQLDTLRELGLWNMAMAFRARSLGMYGASAFSDESVAFMGDYLGEAPEGLMFGAEGTANGIELTWSAPSYSGTSEYLTFNIWRCPWNISFDPFEYELMASVMTARSQGGRYVDSAAHGTTFHYVIVALSPMGISLKSEVLSATSRQGEPGAPRNVTATPSGTSIALAWESPEGGGALGYRIFRAVNGGEYTQVAEVGPGETRYVDTGLGPARYDYRVIAFGLAGNGDPSGVSTATIGASPADTAILISLVALVAVVMAAIFLWARRR
jgi:hypothetical protein